jgi:hypothetical protein
MKKIMSCGKVDNCDKFWGEKCPLSQNQDAVASSWGRFWVIFLIWIKSVVLLHQNQEASEFRNSLFSYLSF